MQLEKQLKMDNGVMLNFFAEKWRDSEIYLLPSFWNCILDWYYYKQHQDPRDIKLVTW